MAPGIVGKRALCFVSMGCLCRLPWWFWNAAEFKDWEMTSRTKLRQSKRLACKPNSEEKKKSHQRIPGTDAEHFLVHQTGADYSLWMPS